jgi:hypothetical protein
MEQSHIPDYDTVFGDIFASHPQTQPIFRPLSKLGYKKSLPLFKDLQCNYGISTRELEIYLKTNAKNIAIFRLEQITNTSLRFIHYYKTNSGNYLWRSHILYIAYPNTNGEFVMSITKMRDVLPKLEPQYHDQRYYIFIDPFTSYKILSKRIPCVESIPSYAKNKTIDIYYNNLKFLQDLTPYFVPLIDLYIMGIQNIFEASDEYISNWRIPSSPNNPIEDVETFREHMSDYIDSHEDKRKYAHMVVGDALELLI